MRRSIAIILAAVLALSVSAEIGLRSFVSAAGKIHFLQLTEDDPVLDWRLRPGFRSENRKILINSFGLRDDKEINARKSDGFIRVICIGDSVAFGAYMDDAEETYPKQLEGLLNMRLNERFEVINAGVPGYTSKQCLLYFKNALINLNPDIIVVYCGWNDIWTYRNPGANTAASPAFRSISRALGKSYLYIYLKTRLIYPARTRLASIKLSNQPLCKQHDYDKEREATANYRDNLTALAEIAKRNGINVYLVTLPSPVRTAGNETAYADFPLTVSWHEGYSIFYETKENFNAIIRIVSKDSKIGLIDLDYYFNALSGEDVMDLFTDAVHPNVAGNSIIAEKLYEAIAKDL